MVGMLNWVCRMTQFVYLVGIVQLGTSADDLVCVYGWYAELGTSADDLVCVYGWYAELGILADDLVCVYGWYAELVMSVCYWLM